MVRPVRLQLSRRRGFNLQELSRATNGLEAVNVTRSGFCGGKYGNPITIEFCRSWFDLGSDAARMKAVRLHRDWIERRLPRGWTDKTPPAFEEIVNDLRGRNVACVCGLDQACHGDVLLEIANR